MPTITTSDQVSIHYTSQGGGPTVVLLHGLGSAGCDWQPQIEHLAARYRVVTVDMRGHGESELTKEGYAIERLARDVLEVMDALKIESAHVMGISMGGALAFQMAVDAPDRVDSLIIVNSGPTARTGSPRYWLYVQLRKLMAWVVSPAKAGPKIAARLFPDPAMEDKRQAFIRQIARMNPVAYRKSLFALLRWDVVAHLGGMRCPTLFLTGAEDYTPPQAKQRFAAMMPNARVEVVPDAHHALPMEYPEAFNACVDRFLEKLESESDKQTAVAGSP